MNEFANELTCYKERLGQLLSSAASYDKGDVPALKPLRSHLRRAKDLISRAAQSQLQDVKSAITEALLPFSNGLESAERMAIKTDTFHSCLARLQPHYGADSDNDPIEEGKLVAELVDQLLTGEDFFACCRKEGVQS